MAKAIPGWPAERIVEKTGIVERRFLWDFDDRTGQAIPPPENDGNFYPANNTDMCEVALRQALERAGLPATDLDAIFVVTCTPDEVNFSHDAMELHHRLGCREDAYAMVIDSGCGGTLYTIDMARKMIASGAVKTVAVIGSAFTSALMNREVYTSELQLENGKSVNAFLSMYVFGDGAGAVILRGEAKAANDSAGVLASLAGSSHGALVHRHGAGNTKLGYQGRIKPVDNAFVVDGLKVAQGYPKYMNACIDGVLEGQEQLKPEVKRYYFHQPNKRLMDHYVLRSGLPKDRVACHVDRNGNTSAAGMLILLAEDLEQGRVAFGRGDLVLLAAVGANIHWGAQLVRL
ncbi:MAG: 3-ketoacyl-ACP synthase [Deltaproteobacteria bacterium]|nr:MAG: 3-ketoacyl-ACP synthase [Deltaproteobacteria bacterium]